MFTTLRKWDGETKFVTLADGKAYAHIEGMGDINIKIDGHKPITLKNVLYVPTLSDPLFSLQQHVSTQGNYVHIEKKMR